MEAIVLLPFLLLLPFSASAQRSDETHSGTGAEVVRRKMGNQAKMAWHGGT